MHLDTTLQARLRERVKQQISLEVEGNVKALYEFIDPEIRRSRCQRYEFEPDLTISQIGEYVAQVHIARIEQVEIEAFAKDGGPSRGHRPVAIVSLRVQYNQEAPSHFRTPWILDNEQWYTLAIGKRRWPGTS